MIPQDVADIANILLANFEPETGSSEKDHSYCVNVAWNIYNQIVEPIIKSYEQAHLEGSY